MVKHVRMGILVGAVILLAPTSVLAALYCEDIELTCGGTAVCFGDEFRNVSGCSADCYAGGEYQGTIHCLPT
jgi:hypothetical protein